jgi:methylmalonyl-CoA mutase C-terminal domain/subunit
VDVIGLSYLSGGHQELTQEIVEELEKAGVKDVPVICGGIIPDQDTPEMKALGVREIYGPGTPVERIIEDIQKFAGARNRAGPDPRQESTPPK